MPGIDRLTIPAGFSVECHQTFEPIVHNFLNVIKWLERELQLKWLILKLSTHWSADKTKETQQYWLDLNSDQSFDVQSNVNIGIKHLTDTQILSSSLILVNGSLSVLQSHWLLIMFEPKRNSSNREEKKEYRIVLREMWRLNFRCFQMVWWIDSNVQCFDTNKVIRRIDTA